MGQKFNQTHRVAFHFPNGEISVYEIGKPDTPAIQGKPMSKVQKIDVVSIAQQHPSGAIVPTILPTMVVVTFDDETSLEFRGIPFIASNRIIEKNIVVPPDKNILANK